VTLETKVRLLPFIFNSDISYKVELGNEYARFYYGDSVLLDGSTEVWIETPYQRDDLWQIQYLQIGDVMWLVHKGYAPRKLSRVSPTEFSLDVIDFRHGPFLLRNDLVDPVNPSTTTLACSATGAGASGVLSATSNIFQPGHAGALFKLTHTKTTSISKGSLGAVGTLCDPIDVKGTWTFNTHGTWTGTVVVERNDNGAGWDQFRTYPGANDRNVQLAKTENDDNIQYRARVSEYTSGTIKGDITVDDGTRQGIVKVLAFINPFDVSVEVYSELESTAATVRWCEGAWSDVRGWPSAITFLNGRCYYAGAGRPAEDSEYTTSNYPVLRL
jgi:hypothetical protein